ncbi:MAG TPA: AtpZ/AtpI family protein [Desulfurobacteriaceae bacterium]|nr:AtpZ/AtpI family protein [Desulfurobacteriaceae bacterium]
MWKLIFLKNKKERKTFLKLLKISSTITSFAFAIIIGFTGGYYLDEYLNTSPLFTLILGLIGIIAGIKVFLEDLKNF